MYNSDILWWLTQLKARNCTPHNISFQSAHHLEAVLRGGHPGGGLYPGVEQEGVQEVCEQGHGDQDSREGSPFHHMAQGKYGLDIYSYTRHTYLDMSTKLHKKPMCHFYIIPPSQPVSSKYIYLLCPQIIVIDQS